METTTAFDAYYVWLGIPPSEQPPDDYRLLGLQYGETDPLVISNASDRQMAHVRTYQRGPHMVAASQLLNELATATRRVLNPVPMACPPAIPLPPPAPPPLPPPVAYVDQEEQFRPIRARRISRRRSLIPQQDPTVVAIEVICGGIAGLILGAAVISAMGYDLRQLFGVP